MQVVREKPVTSEPKEFKLAITPVSIGSIDATIKVTPSEGNEDKYYVAYIFDADAFERNGGMEKIHEWQKSWWNRSGDADFHTNMMAKLIKGEKTFDITTEFPEIVMMKWDCDYVFFAYGVDTVTGDPTTDVFVYDFHTPKGSKQSDNQFTVTIESVAHDAVVARITTTNNDPYMVRCERTTSFVDSYRNKPETELLGGQKPLDAMIYHIMESYYKKMLYETGTGSFPVYQGDKLFTRDDQILLSANRGYTMIIVGFDEGPTTEIKYVDFTTAQTPAEP